MSAPQPKPPADAAPRVPAPDAPATPRVPAADAPATQERLAPRVPAPDAPATQARTAPRSPHGPAAEPSRPRFCSYDDYRDAAIADYPLSSKLVTAIVVGFCGLVSKLLWLWNVEDGEKLWRKPAPGEPGRVVIMNHVSMLEPVILYVTLYAHGIPVRFVYKSEWDRVAPLSYLLSRVGAIPVERGTADLTCVRRAERALKRGEFVAIYPEGTRIRTDDQPVEIHGGFALMAQLGRAKVQPTAVVGARDITTPGRLLKRIFWRVCLKAGDPISFDEVEGKGRKAKAVAMEKLAMERVYALRADLQRRYPHKH